MCRNCNNKLYNHFFTYQTKALCIFGDVSLTFELLFVTM